MDERVSVNTKREKNSHYFHLSHGRQMNNFSRFSPFHVSEGGSGNGNGPKVTFSNTFRNEYHITASKRNALLSPISENLARASFAVWNGEIKACGGEFGWERCALILFFPRVSLVRARRLMSRHISSPPQKLRQCNFAFFTLDHLEGAAGKIALGSKNARLVALNKL